MNSVRPEAASSQCPELLLLGTFCTREEADGWYRQLLQHHHWPENHYEVDGRRFTLPRQQSWHADDGIVYSYSNNLLKTRPWTPLLTELRQRVSVALNHSFNAVLVNLYRHGEDYVGWHADDEVEMGEAPVIASLSLGATRTFSVRRKDSREEFQVPLPGGALLAMVPPFQSEWEHAVLPEPGVCAPRINLTFRRVLPAHPTL